MNNQRRSKTDWNDLDKIIAKFRYAQVDKYVPKNGRIVDIGCGQEGKFLLRHKNKISHGYGLDYKVENHTVDNINFINNRISENLPIIERSIDVVFLNAVLEHLEHPEEVLLNALGLLKKGGKIVMTTPTPIAKPILEFMAYKLHIINESEIKEHVHYYSHEDIVRLVKKLNGIFPVKLEKYEKFEFGANSLIVLVKM